MATGEPQEQEVWDLVIKTLPPKARAMGLTLGWGTKVPQVTGCSQIPLIKNERSAYISLSKYVFIYLAAPGFACSKQVL